MSGYAGRVDPAVVTSEAVALDLEEAGFASRLVARVVDSLLVGVALIAVNVLFGAFLGGLFFDSGLAWLGIVIGVAIYVFAVLGYPMLFETVMRGRTPGKAAVGLRVVQAGGGPIRFRHAAVRAFVGLGEVVLTLGVVAIVTMLLDRRGRRLGDLAAGTVVVRDRVARAARGGTDAQTFAVPPHLAAYAATMDVSGLDAQDYALVRATLLRLQQLPVDARQQVAADVAATVADRVRPSRPDTLDPAWWLHLVAARVQQRRLPGPTPAPPRAPTGPPDAPDAARRDAAPAEWEAPDEPSGFAAPQ